MEGIIYKILDYKESSSLVYLFTPQGLDSVLVRGAKKYKTRALAFCEEISCVSYNKTSSTLGSLIDYEIINRFSNIKKSFTKLKYASIILEVARQSVDERKARIYNFTKLMLEKIDSGYDAKSITFIYLVKMLKVFGILPSLEEDIIHINYFKEVDKLEFSRVFKEAYYTKDYNLKVSFINLLNLISYYNKLDAISTYNINKMLEVNDGTKEKATP